jgi:hypothetical protein
MDVRWGFQLVVGMADVRDTYSVVC